MSGPLLVGIVAAGTVWVLGCRAVASAPPVVRKPPTPAPDPDPTPPPTDGAAQIAGSVDGGTATPATIGGSDVTLGNCPGGNSTKVILGGDGGVVVDHNASRGGADSATMSSTVGSGGVCPTDPTDDTRTAIVDPVAMWTAATRGSTNGLTRQQIAALYTEAYYFTGDVAI